jgi:hypothetical protein
LGKSRDYFPIRQRFARGIDQLGHVTDAALRVGHNTFFFAPLGGRQENMRQLGRRGWMIGVLHNHQFCLPEGFCDDVEVRRGGRRIGAQDPDGLEFPSRQGFELFQRRQTRLGRDAAEGHAPKLLHFIAVLGIGHTAITRQQMRQPANLAPAHRVGLTS